MKDNVVKFPNIYSHESEPKKILPEREILGDIEEMMADIVFWPMKQNQGMKTQYYTCPKETVEVLEKIEEMIHGITSSG